MISLVVSGIDLPREIISKLELYLSKISPLGGVVSVRAVSADYIKQLNRDYAGIDNSTDVLSFPYVESQDSGSTGPETPLADIVISKEHVKKQADIAGTSDEAEFVLLIMHGALHAFGFDHQDRNGQKVMDRHQAEIMGKLGLSYRDFGWLDN